MNDAGARRPNRLVPAPLTRRAITFGWRNRGWFVANVVTVVLLCAARAAPPLVADATADRAFTAEVAANDGDDVPYDRRIGLRSYVTGVADRGVVDRLTAQIDRLPSWGPPTVSFVPEAYEGPFPRPRPVIRRADGTGVDVAAVLYARTGAIDTLVATDASSAAPSADSTPRRGLWLPDVVAAELGVVAGDAVELELVSTAPDDDADPAGTPDPPAVARTVVAGVYQTDEQGLPRSEEFAWASIATDLPNGVETIEAVAPLLIASVDDVVGLAAEMQDTVRVVWDDAWVGPHTVDRGRSASSALTRLAARARDPFDTIGAITKDVGLEPLRLTSGVTTFVERSDQTAAALRPLIDSMAAAIQIVCAAVVAAGTWLLALRRRRETRLSLSHGTHPLRIGVLGVVEQVPAIAVGAIATWLAVDAGASLAAGAGSVAASARRSAREQVVATVPWVLGLVFVVWVVTAATSQTARSSVMRAVAPALRWEVIVTVLAVASGYQLSSEDDASGSTTALLFPILAILAAAAMVALLGATVVRRLRRVSRAEAMPPRRLGWWLCKRRIVSGLSDGAALVVAVAAGVGLLGYTASAARAADAGVDAKAAVLAGARNTAVIPWAASITGAPGMPTGLPDGWAVVWNDKGVDVGASLQIDIEAVDPSTFVGAAEWRQSYADRSLRDLLRSMAAVETDRIGIVVSGFSAGQVPDSGTMSIGFWTVPFVVVDRVEALPGLQDRATMALIDATRLFALIPPNENPTERVPGRIGDNPDGNFRTSVWSSGPSSEFAERLDDAGLGDVTLGGSSVARARPDLVAYGWSLPVLRLVGVVALGVAVLAMLMHVARRHPSTTVDVAMMHEMGVPRRVIRAAIGSELIASAVVGSVVGVVLASGLGQFMIPRLDPDRRLRPRFVPDWALWQTAFAIGVALAAAVLIAARELRSCERANTTEVFRVIG